MESQRKHNEKTNVNVAKLVIDAIHNFQVKEPKYRKVFKKPENWQMEILVLIGLTMI